MLLDRYLPRIDFDSYEDFKENFKINVPEDFNFGFDIVDEWAKQEPDKLALVWCNDHDEERRFTFTDIKKLSNQAAETEEEDSFDDLVDEVVPRAQHVLFEEVNDNVKWDEFGVIPNEYIPVLNLKKEDEDENDDDDLFDEVATPRGRDT